MRNSKNVESLEDFKNSKNQGREEIYHTAIEVLKGLEPLALHQFGSGGKGTSDEFSDLDFFVTLEDKCFEEVVNIREETYSKVAPITVRLWNKIQNPVGWYHDLIIYESDKGLFHVDYYLTPKSKVVIPPNSVLIFGDKDLPSGEEWTLEGLPDSAGHDLYEGILAMSYIGVKGIVRKWDASFFDFLRTLYNSYRRDENPKISELQIENDFNLITAILNNLEKEGNEGQKLANRKIYEYTAQVSKLYK